MRAGLVLRVVLLFVLAEPVPAQLRHSQMLKQRVAENIDAREQQLTEIAAQIWDYAEPPLQEIKSSNLLKEVLRGNGFVIRENLCGFKTVFMATYGSEGPVIGLFGEYDADANAANAVVPRRSVGTIPAYGHGGHHNLLGTGSLGAALAIRDQISEGRLKCTLQYYGTSDEGGVGTKSYLASEGYFDNLDISLYWHPAPATAASTSSWDARLIIQVIFMGAPTNVLNSLSSSHVLQATERFVEDLAKIRADMSATKRLNYSIDMNSEREMIGDSVVFDIVVQTTRQGDANEVLSLLTKSMQGVSAETHVQVELRVLDAKHQFLPNVAAMRAVYSNMLALGAEQYSESEQQFVRQLQQNIGEESKGISYQLAPFKDQSARESLYGYASDIGDASWIAPEIYFVVSTLPSVPMHQWPATIFSNHSIGQRGMLRAAKILAMTIVDYLGDESLRQSVSKEFAGRVGSYHYRFLKSRH